MGFLNKVLDVISDAIDENKQQEIFSVIISSKQKYNIKKIDKKLEKACSNLKIKYYIAGEYEEQILKKGYYTLINLYDYNTAISVKEYLYEVGLNSDIKKIQ